ncbi:hypothetical protein MUU53_17220 [Rhizobium lemnae]|uniref:Uncharacterized protein n=1 Tax=Rhizobium lemnae TaxID=1214924 RepID=A0ABV8EEX2_9HYPH|nr:hypothetical protein [Rhizobium lemnae]MCJ8509650.1 hypothetical protein [Rhizobium lemnae]
MIVSLSLITKIPLPTIGRSIGDDAPPVFRGVPRKTGGRSTWGKIQTALLGRIAPVLTGDFSAEDCEVLEVTQTLSAIKALARKL